MHDEHFPRPCPEVPLLHSFTFVGFLYTLISLLGWLVTGVASQDYNSTNPAHNTLSPLDWEGEELFLPSNLTDLGNLTNAITASSMLDADDILTGILPAEMESLESERPFLFCF